MGIFSDAYNEKLNSEYSTGEDTGKICPRCGNKIFAFKRENGLADIWKCSNENCNGVW